MDRSPDQQHGQRPAQDRRDADPERDWEWRRRIRSNPHSHRVYRTIVGVVGTIVIVGGLVMVPFPGPGWLVVFVGVGILASEFDWAKRLLDFGKAKLHAWNEWVKPKPLWFKGLVGLVTALLVGLFFYLLFLLSGVPSLLPDLVEDLLKNLPGL